MKVPGPNYINYRNVTSLLSPLGVKSTSTLVIETFSAALERLHRKTRTRILSRESTAVLSRFYEEISILHDRTEKLTLNHDQSVFHDRTAKSSDENVVVASAFDAFSPDTGAAEAVYAFTVSQLARNQENQGRAVKGSDMSVVDPGEHTFGIEMNGRRRNHVIEVTKGDTNEVLLEKMKAAVNRSDVPTVRARLCEGEDTDTLWIVLRTHQSGTANAFRVYDVRGSVIRATGAGIVSEKPRDAMYVVDGTVCYSDSNRVYLDRGMVSVDIIGPGQAVLRIGPDRGKVEAAVHELVEGVNGFFDFLEETADHILGEVQGTIRLLLKEHRAALESFGVKMNGDGHLHMDQDALKVLLAQGCSGIREALGDVDGLAARIGEFAERISTDSPLNYAREARQMSPDLEDYIHRTSAFLMKDIIQDTVFPRYHIPTRSRKLAMRS